MGSSILLWLVGCTVIFGLTLGIGQILVGNRALGAGAVTVSTAGLVYLVQRIRRESAA
jgi:hypothetical protein